MSEANASHDMPCCDRDETLAWVTERLRSNDLGISSTALLAYALGAPDLSDPTWGERKPYDHADLGRCERLYERAPQAMQERILPVLERWRDEVWAKYPQRSCATCNPYGRGRGLVVNEDQTAWVPCPDCGGAASFNRAGEPEARPDRRTATA